MSNISLKLKEAVCKITTNWKKEKRKADRADRVSKASLSRMRMYTPRRPSIKEAAYEVMDRAYLHTSGDGRYLANARQIMYAARPHILALTGGDIWKKSEYFTQTLLKDYIEEFSPPWSSRVVWDARGHLTEPHTGKAIGLGGAEVETYMRQWCSGDADSIDIHPSVLIEPDIDTMGPHNRYGAVLFIEKEGFDPILKAAGLAAKFDLAIMSTKGLPVGAACTLLNRFNHAGVRVFVLRDFDLHGFKIVNTARKGARLALGSDVIDLGLRLEDTEDLQSEPVLYSQSKDPKILLREYGATEEECQFLCANRHRDGWSGERVELNAMTSEQLISWLTGKLDEHGVIKVVPEEEVLAQAYRRAKFAAEMNAEVEKLRSSLIERKYDVPDGLQESVRELLDDEKYNRWDLAVWHLAEDA